MSKVRIVIVDYEGENAGEMLQRVLALGEGAEMLAAPTSARVPVPEAPRELAAPPGPVRVPPKAKQPAQRETKAKPESKPKAEPVPAVPDDALATRIADVLQRAPRGSGDLIKLTGGKPSDVYYRLDRMRKAGVIETKLDEADGQRKNYWVG